MKNGHQIMPNLTDEKLCSEKWLIFVHFLWLSLSFEHFPYFFGPSIIHGWKALAMRILMLPSPTLGGTSERTDFCDGRVTEV